VNKITNNKNELDLIQKNHFDLNYNENNYNNSITFNNSIFEKIISKEKLNKSFNKELAIAEQFADSAQEHTGKYKLDYGVTASKLVEAYKNFEEFEVFNLEKEKNKL